MADDTGENSNTTRASEIANKKKADRDLLLKKYRKNEDQQSGQKDVTSNDGLENMLKAKVEKPKPSSELGSLLKRLNEKKEADKQINQSKQVPTSPQKSAEKTENIEEKIGQSVKEAKVEDITPSKPEKAEEKVEDTEKDIDRSVEEAKVEEITPSKPENVGNIDEQIVQSVEETKVEDITQSKPEEAEKKVTEDEKELVTKSDKERSLKELFKTEKLVKTDIQDKADELIKTDELVKADELVKTDEPVKTEESTSDLVKDILEESSTTDISQHIGQDDGEEDLTEQKEDIGFFDKIKNLFKQEEAEIEPYNSELHGPLCIFRGVEGYEELERHWVNEPYAFVVVLFNSEKNHSIYYVVEPELSKFEDTFLTEIKDRLRNILLVEELGEEEDRDAILEKTIRIIIKDYAIDITPPMLAKITYYIKRDFIRFGKLDPLMFDDTIEDVSGNGHDTPIFLYHKKHTNIETNIVYQEDELNSFIIRLAQRSGKHISVAEPMVDATMGDGSRIQMTLGTTITTHGSTFTIRKFSDVPITPIDLIKWKTFSAESMAYIWLCIENNKSLIYAGGTASGKTSSLNAVSLFIPEKAKVITLEDTRELKLPHINWIPALTRDSFTADERGAIDMYDLLKGALRQRPEFLLVGEVRGKEALTLFQAMSTGHTTFSTMHADSVSSAIHRLENPPISVPRTMIQALDIVSIQTQTYSKGKRVRRNLNLVEIVDIDPNTRNIRTNDIFTWDSTSDTFHRTGESKALSDIQMRRGWTSMQVKQELIYRQKVLEYMVNNDVNDFQEISGIINAYQATPEKVLKKLKLIE